MAQIDYNAVIADLREQQTKMNADFENAITGIKTIMAMKARLPHVASEVQPEAPPKSARPTEQRRKYAFGRDPSQPTLADLAAAALPQNGDSMPVSEIRRRLGAADVTSTSLWRHCQVSPTSVLRRSIHHYGVGTVSIKHLYDVIVASN